jgi:hypothetical protein
MTMRRLPIAFPMVLKSLKPDMASTSFALPAAFASNRKAGEFLDYKDIEYQVRQTASPSGWKWTVFLDATRTRTGTSPTKADAVQDAERAIDNAIQRDKRK